MKKLLFILLFVMLWLLPQYAKAQPGLPQRTSQVNATQTLSFGDITLLPSSSGGTVTVDYNGLRSSTGSLVLLNMGTSYQQAIFEFKLCPGRTVSVSYSPTITLTGAKGGSMVLDIGPTNIGVSGSKFTSNQGCDDIHLISVGGTLHVGSIGANPSGLYSGSFNLTFIQE